MYEISHRYHNNLPFLTDIPEQNVIFAICASESEVCRLCLLKELLIKTLFSLASKPTESMFNVVGCASKVLTWQTSLVRCSLTTVTEAAVWVRALQLNRRANVLSAMVAALEDPTCQAVYLFTSGLPEYTVKEICNHLEETERPCAVHFVYLEGSSEGGESSSLVLLETVAKKSGGSFQAINLNSNGVSDEDNPGCTTDLNCCNCIRKADDTPLLRGHYTSARLPLCPWSPDSPKSFIKSSAEEGFFDWSPAIENLQRGIRVLARRETDGYYYLGHIVQKVKGSRELVLIEFEKSLHSRKGKAQFRLQETPLFDVIHFEDGRWQPLAPGDGVLAPWEKKGERYGPGIVLQVTESGLSQSAVKNSEVLVNFWNGHTKKVPADVAVRIPLPLSERIVLEFQMPLAARQMLVEQNPDYPYIVPPGYRASGPCRENHWQDSPKVHCVCTTCSSAHLPLRNSCFSAWEPFRSSVCTVQPGEALIPGSNLTKDELNRKIDEQLSKGEHAISERKEQDENKTIKKERRLAENTDTKHSKVHQQGRTSEGPRVGAGTTANAATNTNKRKIEQKQKTAFFQPYLNKPSAQLNLRHSSQTTSDGNTSQLQAIFERVHQSLKKDRITMESVLPMRRSYSVPSLQRSVMKGEPQGGTREMDLNTARIEFRRQKWKQRQLKEEQQRQEEDLKRELQFDSKRERSLQRTLQTFQKEENSGSKAGRHMEQLQIAKAQRRRQELCLQEEEKSKEHQRLEFLKAQHRDQEKWLTEQNQKIDDHEKKRLALLQNRRKSMQKKLEVTVQEEDLRKKGKEAAKCKTLHKQEQLSQRTEKERQKHNDLCKYVQQQSLLTLRATLLP